LIEGGVMIQEKIINPTFRILSAIMIVFVVSGHMGAGNGGISFFYDWFHPYQFHVFVFVAISGYFYNTVSENGIKTYINKKIKKLLIPLYVWNIIYGIIGNLFFINLWPSLQMINIQMTIQPFNLYNVIVMPLLNGNQFLFNGPCWFIPPLFFAEIVNVIFRKFFFSNSTKHELLIFVLYNAIGIGGFTLSFLLHDENGGLLLFRTMSFLGYFSYGRLYKTLLEQKDTLSNFWYFFIILFFQLVMIYVVEYYLKGSLITVYAWMGNSIAIVPFLAGSIGGGFWLRIAKIITPICKESKIFTVIGSNTYAIMIHHLLGMMFLKSMFAIGFLYFGIFSQFDINAYTHDFGYYYYPGGIRQFGIVYLVVGIGFSLIIQKYTKSIIKRMHHIFL